MNDNPSKNRHNLSKEVVSEAIDRNRQKSCKKYTEVFDFTIDGDAVVQVSSPEDEREHVVKLSRRTAVTCTCYSHREVVGRDDCRHMRAVNAHPQL